MSDDPTPHLSSEPPAPTETALPAMVQQELENILPLTARLRHGLMQLGGMSVMLAQSLARMFSRPVGTGEMSYQIEALGVRSLSIATLTAVFAGLVIALQFAFFLARFGVQHTVGKVVVLTLFRELGPVLTALTVGARIGSGITAELGSMKVTEQLDAIRALGADPIKKLVSPRLFACMLVMPALTALADVLGLIAGSVVVKSQYEIPFDQYFRSALETVTMVDFGSGIAKSAVFGVIIAIVGCFKGFNVEGGTEGVGRATTETVAISSVSVLLSDFFLTKLFLAL